MDAAEIVVHEVQGDRMFQVVELLAESVPQPGKAPHAHSDCEVLAFHIAGGNVARIRAARNDRQLVAHYPSFFWPHHAFSICTQDPNKARLLINKCLLQSKPFTRAGAAARTPTGLPRHCYPARSLHRLRRGDHNWNRPANRRRPKNEPNADATRAIPRREELCELHP